MSGRVFIYVFVGFTAVFAAALWWFMTRAWLEEVAPKDAVTIAGAAYPVTEFRGVDADTSPLRLRSCFRVSGEVTAPAAPDATPLTTPGWFDCYDAEALTRDLASGEARAVIAEFNEPYGFDRIVALYPDGRAYEWRQMNACGEAQAAGDAPPPECPPKD